MFLSWQNWQKNSALRWVVGVAITFFFLCLGLTLHRYFSFYASYDQGIFNQVFWNSSHGRLFQSSLSSALSTNVVHQGEFPNVSYHRLGQHFTPALLLWLPLYVLFPSPVTLTVLQVTLITVAGLVLYILARQYLEPPLAAFITVSFYAANAVIGPTLSNFHDICQIPLFMFTALLAMEKRWWWLFWVCAVLILMVREDSAINLFGIGIYLILSKRYPVQGVLVCFLSFGYILALTNFIMPLFSADISERFMMERFGQYADGEEASTLEILWGIVSNPGRLIVELFTPFWGTLKYLLGQWLPLAFIPAIAPASWMIAGFPLLKLFMAKGESVLSITIRYALTVVPGLFYGTILWWANRQKQLQDKLNLQLNLEGGEISESKVTLPSVKFRRFWLFCIGLSLFFSFTSNPNRTLYFIIPDSIDPWVYIPVTTQWSHVAQFRPLLAEIPPDASVATTTYIVPHLSSRREILRFPLYQLRNDAGEVISVEYILADLWQLQKYGVAFSGDRNSFNEITQRIEQLTNNKEYGIIDFRDGVILMKKGVPSKPEAVKNYTSFLASSH
ncbi:hypothetical protein PCC9214_04473 [Planktothrix tepida]|uniref:Uncharacterized protein n=1 Tax=Planktothrix tepida PCC 9214 TaxID=671072 RepID=A0A1J1LUT2_9CYAN|nr:DUF2079 domain-containing protein [Planktothrix tepida]CAD5979154.1 hypothetical protein PCC9214_04473 [Planktothrix tepida]CUR36175.1 conserved membrane hypothetical protein [Planktothrix tepida PCC 9214]